MPTPRKPTNVLDRRGAFRKNPQRRRDPSPEARGELGEPPDHLTEPEAAAWRDLASEIPEGVAGASDRIALECLAVLVADLRENRRAFPASKLGHLNGLLKSFGLTPADRARVQVAQPPSDDWRI